MNLTDPYGLGLRWYDWFGIATDAAWSSVNPMNYSENLQREIGGIVGFGKFVGETAVGLGGLALDVGLAQNPIQDFGAKERLAERGEGFANVIAHPIDTVAGSWNRMAAKVEAHEAAGEYFSAGVEAGEWGSAAGAVVVGGVESAATVARVARAAVSMEGIAGGVSEGLSAAGREMAPASVAKTASGRGTLWSKVDTPWGRRVFQRGDADWAFTRPEGTSMAGLTNLEAAELGYAPVRINPRTGRIDKLVLHHLNKEPGGALAELWSSTHDLRHAADRLAGRGLTRTTYDPLRGWRSASPALDDAFRVEQSVYWRWYKAGYVPPPGGVTVPGSIQPRLP